MLSVTHVAIFNADMKGGSPPQVFVELPIEETSSHRSRGYWIRVATDAALGMAGRFRRIAEESAV